MIHQLKEIVEITKLTGKYIWYRAAVYGIICGSVLLYLLILAFIGSVFGAGTFWVLLVLSAALAITVGAPRLVTEYVFCILRSGHVALLSEIIVEGHPPVGVSQVKWAREQVESTFKGFALLSRIGLCLRVIFQDINRSLFDTVRLFSFPGLPNATRFAQQLTDFSLHYLIEAALAYVFKKKDKHILGSTKTAVLYYCQSWQELVGTSIRLTLWGYLFVLAVSIFFLIPTGIIASMLSDTATVAKFVLFAVAFCLGYLAKLIVYDAVATTYMIHMLLQETDLFVPAPDWEEKVAAVSNAFVVLKEDAEKKPREDKPKVKRTKRNVAS